MTNRTWRAGAFHCLKSTVPPGPQPRSSLEAAFMATIVTHKEEQFPTYRLTTRSGPADGGPPWARDLRSGARTH